MLLIPASDIPDTVILHETCPKRLLKADYRLLTEYKADHEPFCPSAAACLELLAKARREPVICGFVSPDAAWTLLVSRLQNLLSCSWVMQSLIRNQAGQRRAAQLGSEEVRAEPHEGPARHKGWR